MRKNEGIEVKVDGEVGSVSQDILWTHGENE